MQRKTGWTLLVVVALLVVVGVNVGGCNGDEADGTGGANGGTATGLQASVTDPEAENPDRGRWVDLSTVPFRPEAVGGTLVFARQSAYKSLNNITRRTESLRGIFENLLAPYLLAVPADPHPVNGFAPIPCAAKKLPTLSADRLSSVWTLRDDLTWEDGKPLTAEDYAFTWRLVQSPEAPFRKRGVLSFVKDVKARDAHTLEVTFKRPYYNSIATFGVEFPVVPAHATSPDAKVLTDTHRTLSFGPYKIAEWDTAQLRLTLRNEYREKPFPLWPCYVENIVYRTTESSAIEELAKQGEIDIAALKPLRFEAVGKDPGFRRVCWRSLFDLPAYQYVAWNTKDPKNPSRPHPLFGTAAVRRAMAMLIDREHIIAKMRQGMAKRVNGPYWHRDPEYDTTVAQIPYDPDGARKILEGLGWKLNAENLLEKDGQVFRFELGVYNLPMWTEPAAVIRDGAKKAGVDVVLLTQPWDPFAAAIGGKRFDAYIIGESLRPPIEQDLWPMFHSSQATIPGSSNYVGLTDPLLADKLLDAVRVEFDRSKRLLLRKQFHRVFDQLHPFTVLYTVYSPVVISRRWANVKIHALGVRFRDFVLRDRFQKD